MNKSNSQFSKVYVANGKLDAEMIKVFLEASGIPAILTQESAGRTLGLTIGKLGEVEVLVPVENETDARKLLDAMEHGDFELGLNDENNGSPDDV